MHHLAVIPRHGFPAARSSGEPFWNTGSPSSSCHRKIGTKLPQGDCVRGKRSTD